MSNPLSEHDALVALARTALVDDDMCAHDVIEALRAWGHGVIIEEAREVIDDDEHEAGIASNNEDPEPDEMT